MADAGCGSAVVRWCLANSVAAALMQGVPGAHAGMVVKGSRWVAIDGTGHELGHWPKRGCCGPSVVQSVPGHEAVLPVGLGRCGGALGWLQRAKVSMMIMWPPQHGQGV